MLKNLHVDLYTCNYYKYVNHLFLFINIYIWTLYPWPQCNHLKRQWDDIISDNQQRMGNIKQISSNEHGVWIKTYENRCEKKNNMQFLLGVWGAANFQLLSWICWDLAKQHLSTEPFSEEIKARRLLMGRLTEIHWPFVLIGI